MRKPTSCFRQQALPGVFIDDIQNAEGLAVVRAGLDKVITPNMLGKLRFETERRAIIQP